jgi:hypothetical protein
MEDTFRTTRRTRKRQDATRTKSSMFEIRNLQKPRELSQPNQLYLVGFSGRFLRQLFRGPGRGIP